MKLSHLFFVFRSLIVCAVFLLLDVICAQNIKAQTNDITLVVTYDGTNYVANGFKFSINSETQEASVIGSDPKICKDEVIIPSAVSYNGVNYSVTNIGKEAFWACTEMVTVQIPNSVTNIGQSAFGNCHSLINITIPNSVTNIENWAFGYCRALNNVTLSSSLTTIADYTFMYCTELTNIVIPKNIVSIGICAFGNCTKLERIINLAEIPQEIQNLSFNSINESCVLYVKKDYKASYQNANYWQNFLIENLTEVGFDGTYYVANGLKYTINSETQEATVTESDSEICIDEVVIPSTISYNDAIFTVTVIGERAFGNCSALTNIKIPNSIISIGEYVFNSCIYEA